MYQFFMDSNVSITKLLQINHRISLFNVRLHVVFKLLSQQPTTIKLIQMSLSLLSRHFVILLHHY